MQAGAAFVIEAQSLFFDDDFKGALAMVNNAVSAAPSSADYYSHRAQIHIKMNNLTDAVEDANEAIRLDSKNVKAHFRKGVACFNLEEYPTALKSFKQCAALDAKYQNSKMWVRKCEAEMEEDSDDDEDTAVMPPAAKPAAVAAPAPAAATAAAAASAVSKPSSTRPEIAEATGAAASVRHDWMQNAAFVTVSVYAKGVKKANCEVDFDTDSVMVTLQLNDSSEYQLYLDLAGVIDPMACKFEVLSTKIEIKLKKNPEVKWDALESAEAEALKVKSMADSDNPVQKAYPTSQGKKKDWNAVEQQMKKDEMAEKPEGDEALNKLFKEIYGNANEDTRRAMMKSFQTSGGTVLSTNWDEVGEKDYEKERDDGNLSAPNGMEWKKWG